MDRGNLPPNESAGVLSVILQDVSEIGAMPEKGLRVLQAAVVDAGGNPGVYVSLARVMQQAEVPDLEELLQIAEYLWA